MAKLLTAPDPNQLIQDQAHRAHTDGAVGDIESGKMALEKHGR